MKELVALDIEYYLSPVSGGHPTHIAIVTENGEIAFNEFFKVADTSIPMSSEKKRHLQKHTLRNWSEYKEFISNFLKNKIVAGHDLEKDFKALGLNIADYETIDTAKIKEFMHITYVPRKLKNITKEYLKRNIQPSSRTVHDALEDAVATMDLIKYYISLQQSENIPDLIQFVQPPINYAKNMEGLRWNMPARVPNVQPMRSLNEFLQIPYANTTPPLLTFPPTKTGNNYAKNMEGLRWNSQNNGNLLTFPTAKTRKNYAKNMEGLRWNSQNNGNLLTFPTIQNYSKNMEGLDVRNTKNTRKNSKSIIHKLKQFFKK
jgi:DNA polymerase III epsilon subunit-like protein